MLVQKINTDAVAAEPPTQVLVSVFMQVPN